jgi:hypothetical protein
MTAMAATIVAAKAPLSLLQIPNHSGLTQLWLFKPSTLVVSFFHW